MGHIRVEELSPDLLDDYLRFFDHEAFTDNPAWAACYCYYHHFTGTDEEWAARSGAENRKAVSDLITSGQMQGLLAYEGDRPVGWVHATVLSLLPNSGGSQASVPSDVPGEPSDPPVDPAKTGCILCFVVAPPYRRQGVAARLLEEACAFFARRGITHIIAYPRADAATPAANYHGPLALYRRAGFTPVRTDGATVVVQKTLNRQGGKA